MGDIEAALANIMKRAREVEELPFSIQAKRLGEAYLRYRKMYEVTLLRADVPAYKASGEFWYGDLITPRSDSTFKGVGKPHIIVEVLDPGKFIFSGDNPATTSFGRAPNIRILCMDGNHVVPYWCESWEYERYTGGIAA